MSKRITIPSYTPPELPVCPDDIPIMIAGIVVLALIPVVFVCAWIWGNT